MAAKTPDWQQLQVGAKSRSYLITFAGVARSYNIFAYVGSARNISNVDTPTAHNEQPDSWCD